MNIIESMVVGKKGQGRQWKLYFENVKQYLKILKSSEVKREEIKYLREW